MMKEFLELVQTVSFLGILAGGMASSRSSRSGALLGVSLFLCVGSFLLQTYWEEVTAWFVMLFTWAAWGTAALAALFVGIKLAKRLLVGRRI